MPCQTTQCTYPTMSVGFAAPKATLGHLHSTQDEASRHHHSTSPCSMWMCRWFPRQNTHALKMVICRNKVVLIDPKKVPFVNYHLKNTKRAPRWWFSWGKRAPRFDTYLNTFTITNTPTPSVLHRMNGSGQSCIAMRTFTVPKIKHGGTFTAPSEI